MPSSSLAITPKLIARPRADGRPTWVSDELIRRTIEIWQRFHPRPLTPQEALAIILPVGRLLDVLLER